MASTAQLTLWTADEIQAPLVERSAETREARSRYRALFGQVLRLGDWLTGPQAAALPETEWQERYDQYRALLMEVRSLGNELTPVSLRSWGELLSGSALSSEVAELFAA
jgi:hypothetical protein